ncbi:hypothetical protein EBZ38_11200 [bacterium]|nr:hypothetical protein [bacterium]NDD84817.1 hypothetical protein [bacterium]NDG19157.1 hypothetical protein [Betaproteobacteria bacterium]
MSFNSPFTGNVIQPTDVSYRAITLSANTQLEWPINGNATDDFAARIMQVTASSGGLSLYMPPANQASVGQDALIRNVGANTFTVKDYEGVNTIISVAAGESKYIYITANSTEQGTWGIISFGTGTSAADAATLAGYGLLASGATLNQSHPAQSLITGYTFTTTDRAQTYIWSGGVASATLPAVSTVANNWFVLFKNNGSGAVTINTSGGQLIDGAISKTFNPTESAFIICTGTEYITVGYGVSQTFAFNVLTKAVTTGTYTLTASEASNTIQIYTGVLIGNVTIEFPPVSNLYVISNQTTAGGNTLTITTGLVGATSVTVPAGEQATVFCDGTDFYSANTVVVGGATFSLNSGTAGAPSLNFLAETNTGVYRPGAGRFGVSVLSNLVLDVSATGINVTGAGNFTTGISGGTF